MLFEVLLPEESPNPRDGCSLQKADYGPSLYLRGYFGQSSFHWENLVTISFY